MFALRSIQSRMNDTFKSLDLALHASIRDNNLTRLQLLIDALSPADLNKRLRTNDGDWGMPLHVAVICNNPAAVDVLLSAGAKPLILRRIGDDASTPLSIAARQGNRAILRQLWQHIDPDHHAGNYLGFQFCLVQAAMYGQPLTIADLLDWWDGWSPKAREYALRWAAMRWKVYAVELLLSKLSFEQQLLDTALCDASDFKSLMVYETIVDYEGVDYFEQQQLIALLVDAGANPNATFNQEPLIQSAACSVNLVGALKALLQKGADPNATNQAGDSALHHLGFPVRLHQGSPETGLHETGIRLLLEHHASVRQQNKSGETPLHHAAAGSNVRILQLYLSACPIEERDAFMRSKNNHGEMLLHFAAAGCNIEIIEYLLSHGGMEANINDVNSNGWTPLMCALAQTASRHGDDGKQLSEVIPAARLLLAHGADPFVATAEGWTPLHCLALYFGKDLSGETAQLIDSLVLAGADVNARALFPVQDPSPGPLKSSDLMMFGWGHQVEEIIKYPATKGMMIRSGLTPLHFAAAHGAVGVVKALLRHGANPAAEDSSETSPAKTAGESTRLECHRDAQDEIVALLIGAGGSY
ncbi:ankyrin repeat-containing domain protein [Ilyonectria sp. MPI-CAGE-AT-0026]|nr:ankyrin repeat-containing domain protein [Ilyonectria sp. MPI-CAGE-AT-0026]